MLYRDDLFQANRRVEDLEAQLRAARADRDQLATVEQPVEPVLTLARDHPTPFEWWPMLVVATGMILYFGYFRPRLDDFDLPLHIIVPSAILGAAIYSLDVVLRSMNGNRSTPWCRLAITGGAIAGAPALLFVFLAFGGIMSVVGPILAAIVGLWCLIGWIRGT